MAEARDFWLSSGFRLLARNGEGRLTLADDFLRAYFLRPEMLPLPESCASEVALHDALVAEPSLAVSAARLAALAVPDARENYETVLRFRDALTEQDTIEHCYLDLFQSGEIGIPPLFIDQLTHVILRNILDGCDDPMRLRAAEVLFRDQRVTQQEGAILLADDETVRAYAESGGGAGLGQLLKESGTSMRSVELDVLSEANDASYRARGDRFDYVLDISFTHPGLDCLCRVFEAWIRHLLDVEVSIQPLESIQDEKWVWHLGLDAVASGILNDLYRGVEVGEERLARMVSLFRLTFRDPALVLPHVAGRPIYLGMGMTADGVLRLKPQNLLFNLPLAQAA